MNPFGAWLNDGWTAWRHTAHTMVALAEVFIRVPGPVVVPISLGQYPIPRSRI